MSFTIPQVTVPPWVHGTLYVIAAGLAVVIHLATNGNIKVDAADVALLGAVLSAVNSVNEEKVADKVLAKRALLARQAQLDVLRQAEVTPGSKTPSIPITFEDKK